MTCPKKPNRTRPRYFKLKDLGRICGEVQDHSATSTQTLAACIIATGNTNEIEIIYRQTVVLRSLARSLAGLFIVGRITTVLSLVISILRELSARLKSAPYPPLTPYVSIIEQGLALLKELALSVGGVASLLRAIFLLSSDWLDEIRAEIYRQLNEQPPLIDAPKDEQPS